MADVEEPQFQTLAERIAALNKQKNFQAPDSKPKKAPPPPPPVRPTPEHRSQTLPVVSVAAASSPALPARPSRPAVREPPGPPLPRRVTDGVSTDLVVLPDRNAPPALPTRSASSQISPALPPRRPSSHSLLDVDARRKSTASEISQISTISSMSLNNVHSSATSVHSIDGPARKLPPAFDQASLPPLPPTKRELEAKARETAAERSPLLPSRSAPVVRQIEAAPAPPSRPPQPPRLPSRPAQSPVPQPAESPAPSLPARRLPPAPAAYVKAPSTNSHGRNGAAPPPLPTGLRHAVDDDAPPPVPLASRPTVKQLDQSAARAAAAQQNSCLLCRDFSGPDAVAAQHPRHSLPRRDPAGYLAKVLCDPFPSPTDKARAIFTWFHHNIAYDVASFFGNSVTHKTAEDTLASGVAVCGGYAETYKTIATRAGLECVMVVGHGKGIQFTDLKKGAPIPPRDPTGHAWNAVRIDGGEWKLLDACWGAGNVNGATQSYTPAFKPIEFTASNEVLGYKHFPENPAYFFRRDGTVPTWEEYIVGPFQGERPETFSNAYQEGLDVYSVAPRDRYIAVHSGDVVRFQFSKVCPHWTSERNGLGKPVLMLMSFNGVDGRKKDTVPMETDGNWWWIDVRARDLGAPGETVSVVCLDQFDGRDARGVTAREYLAKKGRVGMRWMGVFKWTLV